MLHSQLGTRVANVGRTEVEKVTLSLLESLKRPENIMNFAEFDPPFLINNFWTVFHDIRHAKSFSENFLSEWLTGCLLRA